MQVGDYVRLDKNRGIRKIKEFDEHIDYYVFDKPVLDRWGKISYSHFGIKEQILKSSPNIIDLIEVGDYVNGMEVMEADWFNENGEYEEGLAFPMYASDDLQVIENWLPLRSVNIKSIVTKEQFEEMEYKICV